MPRIEVYVSGELKHVWQLKVFHTTAKKWEDKVKYRISAIDKFKEQLIAEVAPNFDMRITEFFIVFESKM